MKRYKIWDKITPIITPIGEVFTAEQWMDRYPVAKLDSITVLCGAGEINGSVFATLGQTVMDYERVGCDFSDCITDEEKLAAIEAFDDAREAAERKAAEEAAEEARMNETMQADSLASIAASLEFQNMMALPDVEV